MKPSTRKLQDGASPPLSSSIRKPSPNTTPIGYKFDVSMTITILVFLCAIFFMALFSLYIRRFAEENTVVRRRNSTPPTEEKGVNPEALRSLPRITYSRGKFPEDCSICLGEFEENESVKMIPYCKHVYHSLCIDTWLSSHLTCPLCRSSMEKEIRLNIAGENVVGTATIEASTSV